MEIRNDGILLDYIMGCKLVWANQGIHITDAAPSQYSWSNVDGSSEGILDRASDSLSDGIMSDGFWDGKDWMVDLMESRQVYWKLLQKV